MARELSLDTKRQILPPPDARLLSSSLNTRQSSSEWTSWPLRRLFGMGMRAFEVEEEEGPEGKSSDVAEGGGRKVVEVLGEGTGERFDIVRGFSLLSLFGMEGKQRKKGRKEVEASSAASPIPLSLFPPSGHHQT